MARLPNRCVVYAGHLARAFAALALTLAAAAPAAASDPCLCTQRIDFRSVDGAHNWFVTADASGELTVTLVIGISATNTGQVFADQLNAKVYDSAGAVVGEIALSYPDNSEPDQWIRGHAVITPATPGAVYRVEVFRAVPHLTLNHATRYWLRLDGADDAAIDGELRSLNGGRTTWVLHADAGDAMGVRIFDPFTFSIPAGDYPVMYQWIAPDGTAQPVGSYTVPGPGMDTMIPPPAGLVPGKWMLRLQTLSFTNVGWGYGIEKTTGTDRRLHVEPGLAGLGRGGYIRFVDGDGNLFTDPVDITFGFGESGTFTITGGLFETTNDTDVFPIPIAITPPPGLVASPAQFAFLPPCDGFFDQTVVIAAAPPTIAVSLTPNVLWPPNHKLVDIAAHVTSAGPDGNAVAVELVSITNNETGANDFAGATFGTDDRAFQLRATRFGGGSGRTYTVVYRVTDTGTGLSATASATVTVPHDKR